MNVSLMFVFSGKFINRTGLLSLRKFFSDSSYYYIRRYIHQFTPTVLSCMNSIFPSSLYEPFIAGICVTGSLKKADIKL